jgi:hypothetical protein
MVAASTIRSDRPGAPRHELAEIVRAHAEAYGARHAVRPDQWKVLRAIMACRTAELGGHVDRCVDCGVDRPSYNSCRNRHCPKCQGSSQIAWVEERKKQLLEVGYFHCVFTLPSCLRPIAKRNERVVYDLLFRAASDTLLTLGHDPKRFDGLVGVTAVLHTWTRDLSYHPHIHAIVTGGGLSRDGTRWTGPRHPDFLFPVKVMGALFAGKFLAGLRLAWERGGLTLPAELAAPVQFEALIDSLRAKDWVVYAKRSFAGPEQVITYLGQYTHRVGLSNRRLLDVTDDRIVLATRDGKSTTMTPEVLIGRFLEHILPSGFVKVRHYGLWAAANRPRLATAMALLTPPARAEVPSPEPDATAAVVEDAWTCPNCGGCRFERLPVPRHRSAHAIAIVTAFHGPSG